MSGRGTRLFLILVSLTMTAAAVVFAVRPPEIHWIPVPSNQRVLAARIARHPTDWPAATALTEVALDQPGDNRLLLWRAAYEQASQLAPERLDPPKAFARAAFFHWTELSAKDQGDALAVFAPLLRDQATFTRMAKPIYELTGNLAIPLRWHPPDDQTIGTLMYLSSQNGFFTDYRNLRSELERRRSEELAAQLHTATPAELIEHFPAPPYHSDAEPLITSLLEELHRRPLDDNPNHPQVVDAIVDYAMRHGLGPLDGLEIITRKTGAASVATRIRLARKLGRSELALQLEMGSNDPRRVQPLDSDWQGLCDADICSRAWRTINAEHGIALSIDTVLADNVPAYVEIYLDDVLRAEGEVGPKRDFIVAAGNPGPHRVEIVLTNPVTRNLLPRRVHVASITTL